MSVALDLSAFAPAGPSVEPAVRHLALAPDLAPHRAPGRPARPARQPDRVATVVRLHRPSSSSIAAPLRLTHRGVAVLAAAVGLVAAGLLWVAWLSAPQGSAAPVRPASVPAVVTVQPGDTLWAIADRVAPGADPRAEVAALQRLNHLSSAALAIGQQLRTR